MFDYFYPIYNVAMLEIW